MRVMAVCERVRMGWAVEGVRGIDRRGAPVPLRVGVRLRMGGWMWMSMRERGVRWIVGQEIARRSRIGADAQPMCGRGRSRVRVPHQVTRLLLLRRHRRPCRRRSRIMLHTLMWWVRRVMRRSCARRIGCCTENCHDIICDAVYIGMIDDSESRRRCVCSEGCQAGKLSCLAAENGHESVTSSARPSAKFKGTLVIDVIDAGARHTRCARSSRLPLSSSQVSMPTHQIPHGAMQCHEGESITACS